MRAASGQSASPVLVTTDALYRRNRVT